MDITYHSDRAISPEEFIDVLRRSTLSDRRPVDDRECIATMLRNADLLCTAWNGKELVGVARSLTDFCYCCYLSDLAVDVKFQRRGIGRELVRLTQGRLQSGCKIVLLAAPQAVHYYLRLGFARHDSAWLIAADTPLHP